MEDVRDYDNVEGVRCTKDVHDAASLSEAGEAGDVRDATGLSGVASLSETKPAEALRDAAGLNEAEFLAAYDPKDWPRPSMTADVVLFAFDDTTGEPARHTLHVLLIKRGGHPCLGMWAFPGGFMNPGETVGETAIRELFEETGIRLGAAQLRQLRVFSRPGRDPRTWVITCTHMAVLNSASTIQTPHAADDAQEARWFELTYDLREIVDLLGNVHDITSLVLRSGNIELAASVSFSPGNDEFRVIENTGLAFDHAEMLACAIQELETW